MSHASPGVFQVGSYVIYRQQGVYQVTDIRTEEFSGNVKQYLVLSAVSNSKTKIFIPLDHPNLLLHLRAPLTQDELNRVLTSCDPLKLPWSDDPKQRSEIFQSILNEFDRSLILSLYLRLCKHKTETLRQKRRFYASDEKYLSLAEQMITDEFSFVLQIPRENVIPLLLEKTTKTKIDD